MRKPCVANQPTNRTRLLGSWFSEHCSLRRVLDSSGLSNDLRGHRWGPWDGPRQPQNDMWDQHVAQISSERHAAVRVLYGLSLSDDTRRAVRNTQARLRSLARVAADQAVRISVVL